MIEALILLSAYMLGSIPTAYILVRRFADRDLRSEGSRNIGARNAYEVTGSKVTGIIILTIDLLKGILPILFLQVINEARYIPVASVAIVIGHCYPIWLQFHGGRGLATAAGVVVLLEPFALIAWVQVYFLSSILKSNIHLNAVLATIVAATVTAVTPVDYFFNILSIPADTVDFLFSLRVSLILMCIVIIIRHVQPLKEYFTE